MPGGFIRHWLALLLTLLGGCYVISHPREGYQVVENILEAPVVAGKGSKSNYLLAGFPWEVANQVDKANFVFFDQLPLSVWECEGTGCATRLQVITDNGTVISHSMRIGQDMHVCTADYIQTAVIMGTVTQGMIL